MSLVYSFSEFRKRRLGLFLFHFPHSSDAFLHPSLGLEYDVILAIIRRRHSIYGYWKICTGFSGLMAMGCSVPGLRS